MAWYLIDRDCEVKVQLGGVQDGAPNWGTEITITGIARRVEGGTEAEQLDVSGIGDGFRFTRAGKRQFRFRVQQLVGSTGYAYRDAQGVELVGNYIRLLIKPSSALQAAHQYEGVITRCNGTISHNEVQFEEIEFVGPAA